MLVAYSAAVVPHYLARDFGDRVAEFRPIGSLMTPHSKSAHSLHKQGMLARGRHPHRAIDHAPFMPDPSQRAVFAAVIAWTIAWKGVSLWRAARNDCKPWFVALLLSNTMGILDAVYLFGVDGKRRRTDTDERSIRAATGEPGQLAHAPETG